MFHLVPHIFWPLFQVERQKIQRENKKKQEARTLEETNKEILALEKKLTQLKDEKHQLFHTLKKVIGRSSEVLRSFAFVSLIFSFPISYRPRTGALGALLCGERGSLSLLLHFSPPDFLLFDFGVCFL